MHPCCTRVYPCCTQAHPPPVDLEGPPRQVHGALAVRAALEHGGDDGGARALVGARMAQRRKRQSVWERGGSTAGLGWREPHRAAGEGRAGAALPHAHAQPASREHLGGRCSARRVLLSSERRRSTPRCRSPSQAPTHFLNRLGTAARRRGKKPKPGAAVDADTGSPQQQRSDQRYNRSVRLSILNPAAPAQTPCWCASGTPGCSRTRGRWR